MWSGGRVGLWAFAFGIACTAACAFATAKRSKGDSVHGVFVLLPPIAAWSAGSLAMILDVRMLVRTMGDTREPMAVLAAIVASGAARSACARLCATALGAGMAFGAGIGLLASHIVGRRSSEVRRISSVPLALAAISLGGVLLEVALRSAAYGALADPPFLYDGRNPDAAIVFVRAAADLAAVARRDRMVELVSLALAIVALAVGLTRRTARWRVVGEIAVGAILFVGAGYVARFPASSLGALRSRARQWPWDRIPGFVPVTIERSTRDEWHAEVFVRPTGIYAQRDSPVAEPVAAVDASADEEAIEGLIRRTLAEHPTRRAHVREDGRPRRAYVALADVTSPATEGWRASAHSDIAIAVDAHTPADEIRRTVSAAIAAGRGSANLSCAGRPWLSTTQAADADSAELPIFDIIARAGHPKRVETLLAGSQEAGDPATDVLLHAVVHVGGHARVVPRTGSASTSFDVESRAETNARPLAPWESPVFDMMRPVVYLQLADDADGAALVHVADRLVALGYRPVLTGGAIPGAPESPGLPIQWPAVTAQVHLSVGSGERTIASGDVDDAARLEAKVEGALIARRADVLECYREQLARFHGYRTEMRFELDVDSEGRVGNVQLHEWEGVLLDEALVTCIDHVLATLSVHGIPQPLGHAVGQLLFEPPSED
jgi:hypothetical protein